MSALDELVAAEGRWVGRSRLQDPHANLADESPSTATVTPILGGRFVRVDYTWTYKRAQQEGSVLLGFDPSTNAITAHWIDTWHMGRKAMVCQGQLQADGTISVQGTYAAPPGPDWGWRIALAADSEILEMVMFNISPEGKEDLAVEAVYSMA